MTRIAVPVAGATLSAQVDGSAGKPWLLLSNSLAADLTMWDDQMNVLIRNYRVVRYDTRGHGHSTASDGAYDFDLLVTDMLAVLDHVGAKQADVIGLSLGGMTALGLGLKHPTRVKRMVVCCARADNPPPFVQGWIDRIAVVRAKGTDALVEGTLARWFTPACAEAPKARAAAMIRATSAAGYIGCARALMGLDYLRQLGAMQAPVQYLVGAEDSGAPKAAMAAMAAATPGAGLIVLESLAHIPNMEDPEAFNAALSDWLQGCE
ncbi:MAG: alpha/beta fold hydrolase [Alphaproteobacteria bacterium]|nr:alpha/beta fold hydrolase [Alphaproteobacteria bacterium]